MSVTQINFGKNKPMKKIHIDWWGIGIFCLSVTWWDCWDNAICLEIVIGNYLIIDL